MHTSDVASATQYGVSNTPAVVVFRKFDNSPVVFTGNFEATPIVDFLLASSVPTLIEFSEDYIEPIFGQRKAAVILFRGSEDASSDFSKVFAEAA